MRTRADRARSLDRGERRRSRAASWSTKVGELPAGHGFNAATGEYGDLIAQGVIDPVKVTRSAVQNAASIAGMLLTTEALVAEKPEKEAADAGHGHGHGARPLIATDRTGSRHPGVRAVHALRSERPVRQA